MASNNYAEIVADSTAGRRTITDFERMAAQGSCFRVMQFNPDVEATTPLEKRLDIVAQEG